MRFFAVALFFFRATASIGQAPEVPHKMQFAGMTLSIRDDARREIQKDVDALTQHPRYFGIKVERAKTYFPLVEKIFAEERLPDDFKFLALQESALVSDAVSVSNAVGFWQFKDFTALEMGLRMDNEVDERMNIISSTHAAAKYLKQNNYMFNNWLYALQSYQMGAGGVQREVGDQHNGAKHMEITSETYWYVKKYLAHKVAFGSAITGEARVKLIQFETNSGKSLHDIAAEVSVEEEKLLEFNKWIKKGVVPSDKPYAVLIPMGDFEDFTKLISASTAFKQEVKLSNPINSGKTESPDKLVVIRINEVPVIKAKEGESIKSLADRAKIDLTSFLKYNDIPIDHAARPGAFYFIAKKKTKSENDFYKTAANEDLWSISQHTGVQIKRIVKYNGPINNKKIAEGSIVWLNGPKQNGDSMPETDAVALVDEEEEFEWNEKIVKEAGRYEEIDKVPEEKDQRSLDYDQAQQPTFQYTVKQGETLYSIAKANNVEILNLLAWNNLTMTDGIKPGQILKLTPAESMGDPKNAEISPTEKIHEVLASDTLYSVARKYGITIKELMDWNGKHDLSLTIGERLRILQK
ncbi:MAG: LysM peptidoglycan-binding domain-containing protein [Bacteroidota bacterium]